jgi:hypothetical protein
MRLKGKIAIFLLFPWLLPVFMQAQTVEAISRLSTDTILIGQQAVYELNLKIPASFTFEWPLWGDTLIGNVEIISAGEVQKKPLDADGNFWLRQELLITSFDSGFYYLPGVELSFSPASDSIFFLAQTNPLMLFVKSVPIDPDAMFKPIKDPLAAPIGFWEIFPWIIGILGIALLIFLIVWYLIKRGKKELPLPIIQKPVVPPHIIALNKLEELRQQKLWQAGKVKDYHSAMSDIIRVYIEDRFGVNAVEMTTDEILHGVDMLGINQEAFAKLARALQLGDLVKFAKAEPTAVENDLCLNHLVDFVNESHGLPSTENESQQAPLAKSNQTDKTV